MGSFDDSANHLVGGYTSGESENDSGTTPAVSQPQAPISGQSAAALLIGTMALAWAGTSVVVWASFRATARFDDRDFPF
jgi:hypothetical protein